MIYTHFPPVWRKAVDPQEHGANKHGTRVGKHKQEQHTRIPRNTACAKKADRLRALGITPKDSAPAWKRVLLEEKARRQTSFRSTRSGGGQTFLVLDCRAKACERGGLFADIGVRAAQVRAWDDRA